MSCAHQGCVVFTIVFRGEYSVGGTPQPFHRIFCPDVWIIFVVAIVDQHDANGRVNGLHPLTSEFSVNEVRWLGADDGDGLLALGGGSVDEQFMSAMRWQEFT